MHSGKQFSARKQIAKEEIGLGRLVGPGGSIRELVCHPSLPYLACVGLDRKLWTWDVSKRKMMDCVYLKQRLNCALFCADDCWSADDGDGKNGGGNDDDDLVNGGEVEYDEPDEEWNNKRERELEEDQDEVEDYIDSDGDNDNEQDSGEETASDSSEEDEEDGSSSSSSSEEEPTPKRGKRQKR